MGLDTTHNCWHGSYGKFNRFRTRICKEAGLGDLGDRIGFGGEVGWDWEDPLSWFLNHSDCDGSISHEECSLIATRLQQVTDTLDGNNPDNEELIKGLQQFIKGLQDAATRKEDVEFR